MKMHLARALFIMVLSPLVITQDLTNGADIHVLLEVASREILKLA